MELLTLLTQMAEREASDLHLAVGVPPVFRVDGELVADQSPNLTAPEIERLLASLLPEDKLAGARRGQPFSATLSHETQTFRCQVFRERGQPAAAIRRILTSIPTMETLALPPVFETLARSLRGLILLTGPAGSGKSTTLMSLLDHINKTRAERIYTVEDPLLYVIGSKLSLLTQCIVGEDVDSMERGLLTVRSLDPDVVLVSEIRTPAAARLALELCDVGILVLAQITAEDVPDALARLLAQLGDPPEAARRLLSRTLKAVVAQKLVPREDGEGRAAVHDILVGTPRVRQMIADGDIRASLLELVMEASLEAGMQTMAQARRHKR